MVRLVRLELTILKSYRFIVHCVTNFPDNGGRDEIRTHMSKTRWSLKPVRLPTFRHSTLLNCFPNIPTSCFLFTPNNIRNSFLIYISSSCCFSLRRKISNNFSCFRINLLNFHTNLFESIR